MPELQLPSVDPAVVSAFLLVLARTSSWVLTAPVLSAKGISAVGRLAACLALALFVTPLVPHTGLPQDLGSFAALALLQVGVGLVLGWLTQLLLGAFEVAGTLIDLQGGFSASSILDPLSGQPAAAFSRLTGLAFTVLLLVTDGWATVLGGFVRSFRALPLDHVPALAGNSVSTLGSATTQVAASALEIAAPLLGVLFLTDVAVGLAARFVPQANALALSLPLKTLVALTAAGATLALLPAHVAGMVDPAVRLPFAVLHP